VLARFVQRQRVLQPKLPSRSERIFMNLRSSIAKWQPLQSPWVRYSVLAVAFTLWGFGPVDQLYSSAATMKYLLISLLIAVVAVL
jgi:hypothetical protein